LISAARPLGVKVLDHIIVGDEKTFSFADNGLIDELELEALAPYPSLQNKRKRKVAQ
jgi:DNA repair protein RadC